MDDTNDDTAPVGGERPGPGPADTSGAPSGQQTGQQTGQDAGRADGPYRRPFDDVERLRRTIDDRHVAGVAGGLGRHLGIDPTILRVAFVVLVFFGGAGLLLYGALWLLVPEEGSSTAAIQMGPESRRTTLIVVGVVAALFAIGDSLGGFSGGWPLAVIAVLVAGYLVVRDKRGAEDPAPGVPPTHQPYGATTDGAPTDAAGTPEGDPMSTTSTGGWTGGADTFAAAGYPPGPPYADEAYTPRPPRRRRTGLILFWPTMAVVAIALGALGIYDGAGNDVADGAYPALALAIIGAALVLGSFVGRPGGLIFAGLITSFVLAAHVVVGGSFGTDARNLRYDPPSADAVESSYSNNVGEIRLDLTKVRDPEELAGRTIDLDLRTGHVHVIVPDELNVRVDAELEYAGGVTIDGDDNGGVNFSDVQYIPARPASKGDPLELDIDAKLGQITVEQR